jgi:hypothetical protein
MSGYMLDNLQNMYIYNIADKMPDKMSEYTSDTMSEWGSLEDLFVGVRAGIPETRVQAKGCWCESSLRAELDEFQDIKPFRHY